MSSMSLSKSRTAAAMMVMAAAGDDFQLFLSCQTRIQRGSDARGGKGDNEVMIYD